MCVDKVSLPWAISPLLSSQGADTSFDITNFLPALCFVSFVYIVLMIAITYTAIKVKKEQYVDEINKGSASCKTNRRIFLSHFVFLQATMLCRLITISILLFYSMGLGDEDNLPVMTIRIIYNTSLIYLCIVYAISLYQWIFIVHRINLYSGLLTLDIFRRRDMLTKIFYSLVIAGTLGFNLVLLVIEAW